MAINYGTFAVPRADLGAAFEQFYSEEQGFIAQQVLGTLPVTLEAATLSVVTRENYAKSTDVKRAPGAAYNRISITGEDLAYQCYNYGLEEILPDENRWKYGRDMDPEMSTVKTLAHHVLLELERRVAAAVINTGTWTGASLTTDISGSAPFATAGSDVIGAVQTAKETCRMLTGKTPDTLILNQTNFNYLLNNTGIKARFPGAAYFGQAEIAAGIAPILGLSKVLVGTAVYDSAKWGQDFTGANVWSSTYAMLCSTAAPNASLTVPCIGRLLIWSPNGTDLAPVSQYRDESIKSDVFRCEHYTDELICDPAFGHLLKVA